MPAPAGPGATPHTLAHTPAPGGEPRLLCNRQGGRVPAPTLTSTHLPYFLLSRQTELLTPLLRHSKNCHALEDSTVTGSSWRRRREKE